MENTINCLICGSEVDLIEDTEYEDIWYKCNECGDEQVVAD